MTSLPGLDTLSDRIVSDLLRKTLTDCSRTLRQNVDLLDNTLSKQYATYLYTMALAKQFADFHIHARFLMDGLKAEEVRNLPLDRYTVKVDLVLDELRDLLIHLHEGSR